ncbi:hypothetical protein [Natronococcus roseus]|uniref:hypothetical protein n=1 Tax=Natronococcus roseus TaxID=1052014 RepID=UPI00374D5650
MSDGGDLLAAAVGAVVIAVVVAMFAAVVYGAWLLSTATLGFEAWAPAIAVTAFLLAAVSAAGASA